MVEIIGVRFKKVGKMYYFDPQGMVFNLDDYVIVETSRGIECGVVVLSNKNVSEQEIVGTLKPIVRKATAQDIATMEQNLVKQAEAAKIFEDKIAKHNIKMNLVDVEVTFDNNKMLFYFTADGRVDFRELVKDLAAIFRTRIELRQIGVRDESKVLGGLGICGRPFCCATFLGDFQPVSIKMAKEQGLSLNPTKISGTCGRLMCCLKYEQDAYDELLSLSPKVGAFVDTPHGKGNVVDMNLISGIVKVRLNSNPDAAPITVRTKEVKIIRDAQIRVNKDELEQLSGLE